jgi:hypothetical protein
MSGASLPSTMTPSFQLLDLRSQVTAVRTTLAGSSPVQVLAWLAERGKVTRMTAEFPDLPTAYRFESTLGAFCIFHFRDGVLQVIGEKSPN